MKRCPACGTVYSVAQGFCPMDGAPLADHAAASEGAPKSTGSRGGAVVPGAWDPPRAGSTSSGDAFVVPPQARAVSASTGPGASAGSFVIPPLGGAGMTATGLVMPPQPSPAPRTDLGPAPATEDPSPADTGLAFIPPVTNPGARRTMVAIVPPTTRSSGSEVLTSLAAPRVDVLPDMSSGTSSAGLSGQQAFFPPGGLSRARPEAPTPTSWEESLIGRVLDQRYRIDSCIGAGGMGVVYKATHVIIDKPLAIKMLRSDVASQPDVVKRFLLEAQLASKVKHPNVVDISDYGQIAGQTAYYVMEYLTGENLAVRIDSQGPVDPALAIEIAIQTAHALQAAHACKIIHRDLKSENIFLCTSAGGGVQVKILDFGIARIRDKRTRLTAMGALIGTPAYMSPEQAQGAEVDERSDLYALGVILFEMLAGRVPFKAATVALVLSAQIYEAAPSLQELAPGGPDLPNIEHVLHCLLAKNRDERPADAAEVIHMLRTAAEMDLGGDEMMPGANHNLHAKRRATVTIGSWSVAENPSGMHFSDNNPAVAGEARASQRPDSDALVARPFTPSGRIQRRPSVIVPAGTHVERIAAPPARPPSTGEESRHYPTGVNAIVPSAGPPMILIIAAAASIGAAITVTLYKVWRRNQVPVVQAPEVIAPVPVPAANLTFESEPAGATVVGERGEVWGVTPFTTSSPPGSARTRVIFKLDGHDEASLEVSAGTSALHKVLLRPRTPLVAPVLEGLTAVGPLGGAAIGGARELENPVEPAVKSTPRVRTRPAMPSKQPPPIAEPATPATQTSDTQNGRSSSNSSSMDELKNPFRDK